MMVSMMPMLTVKEMTVIMMTTFLILILITAILRLRRWLSKQTRYIKPESIKLCIYGDGRILSV